MSPAASFLQTSFLGGEWAPAYQGNADDPFYRKGLNVCLNSLPIEEGAWNRRAGTKQISTTKSALPAKLLAFDFTNAQPYLMELGDGYMRFTDGDSLILDANPPQITAISSALPAVVTTASNHGWSTGDTVIFLPIKNLNVGALALCNRQFSIVQVSDTEFSLYDGLTNQPFDGSTITWVDNPAAVGRVTEIATPWTGPTWQNVRRIQSQNLVMLLASTAMPQAVQAIPPTTGQDATFTLGECVFEDGPYLDFVPSGTQLTFVSGSTWKITFQTYDSGTAYGLGDVVTYSGANYVSLQDTNVGNTPSSSPAYWEATSGYPGVNGGQGFLSTDVGRLIRIWTQPADWDSGTTYAAGDYVTYNDAQYQSLLGSNTGQEPDTAVTYWSIVVNNAQVAGYLWGSINEVTNAGEIVIYNKGGILAVDSNPSEQWQIGVYSNTTGFPTCGCFFQGRFWLGGAVPNRMDATCSNALPPATGQGAVAAFNFAPTDLLGNVSDNNSMSWTFQSDEADDINWMIPDHQGIVIGTAGGEWSLNSGGQGPVTPTSIDAQKVTKYKGYNAEVVRCGFALAYIQLHQRKLLEMMADVYSGKYVGINLSKRAKHMTINGLEEIAYQQETTPVIWARDADGNLYGCTYKRESLFLNTEPAYFAWHRHELGTGRKVISLQSGPSPRGGTLDSVSMVTQDPSTGYCYLEQMQQLWDEDLQPAQAWEVDGAAMPVMGVYTTGTPDTITLYGMSNIAGQTVDIWGAGLDLGSYTISNSGTVTIDVGVGNAALLTQAWLATISDDSLGVPTETLWSGGPPTPAIDTSLEYLPANGDADDAGSFCIDYVNRRAWGCIEYDGRSFGSCRIHCYDLDTQANLGQWDSGAYPNSVFNFNDGGSGFIDAATGDFIIFGVFNNGNGANVIARFHYDPIAGTVTPFRMSLLDNQSAYNHYPTSLNTRLVCGASTLGVALGVNSLQSEMPVYLFDPSTGALLGSYSMAEKYGIVGMGGSFEGYGQAYTAGLPASPSTYILAIYRHQFDEDGVYTATALGHITAPEINSGWANTDSTTITGMVYDQVDGNLILAFGNSTRSENYLAKINVSGPAPFVQWTYATAWIGSGDAVYDLAQSNCAAGRMVFVENDTLYTLDTSTGDATTTATTYSGVVSQRFDDNTGEFYWRGGTNWNTNGLNAGQQNLGLPGEPPYYTPFCVGTTFTSQGQILRALAPQEAGAANGPALAKVRRTQQVGFLLRRSQGISYGTDFSKLYPMNFRYDGGASYPASVLYSGVWWDTLEDDYSFDSMVAWQITRPYPAIVCAVEPFLETSDRD